MVIEPTKEALNEGIMTVMQDKAPTKDQYNIKSGIHDVLVLEVCKNQQTRETVIDCLSQQQASLIESNHRNTLIAGGIAIGSSLIIIFCFIMMCRRSK